MPAYERYEQLSLFDLDKEDTGDQDKKERKLQETMLQLKNKFGKNAVIKARNLEEGGTAIERNNQIGGHKA